jgi:hypothetical protein
VGTYDYTFSRVFAQQGRLSILMSGALHTVFITQVEMAIACRLCTSARIPVGNLEYCMLMGFIHNLVPAYGVRSC